MFEPIVQSLTQMINLQLQLSYYAGLLFRFQIKSSSVPTAGDIRTFLVHLEQASSTEMPGSFESKDIPYIRVLIYLTSRVFKLVSFDSKMKTAY